MPRAPSRLAEVEVPPHPLIITDGWSEDLVKVTWRSEKVVEVPAWVLGPFFVLTSLDEGDPRVCILHHKSDVIVCWTTTEDDAKRVVDFLLEIVPDAFDKATKRAILELCPHWVGRWVKACSDAKRYLEWEYYLEKYGDVDADCTIESTHLAYREISNRATIKEREARGEPVRPGKRGPVRAGELGEG